MRSRTYALLLVLAACIALVSLRSRDGIASRGERNPDNPMRPFAKLKRGMSPEQVRELVGPPKRIARQILYHRYREQWLYETNQPVRLLFDCPLGQLPQLLTLPNFGNNPDGQPNGEKNP